MAASTLLLNRLRHLTVAKPRSRPVRYGVAVLYVAMVAVVQAAIFGSSAPWFLYTPAVVLLTLFLGRGPGIAATALSAICAGMVVVRADEPLLLTPVHWGASIIFVLTTLGLVALVEALRTALLDADRLRDEREGAMVVLAEREAFLSSVLGSSTDCIKVLDLEGKLTFMSEGGQRVMEVSDFNAVAGCPWPDFWADAGNVEAKAAVEAARNGQARSFIGKADTFRGTPKWWHVAVSPVRGADGRPDRILSVSRDISDLRASEEERDRFVRLAENSTDFVGMARADGSVFYMNDAARRLVGLEDADITRLAIADFFPPEQVEKIGQEALPAVARDGHWAGELNFRHFGTGELIPVLYSVFPITDATGALIGYGTVTRDFREQKRTDEQMQLLNGELAHRLKNTLSVVQAIAMQTLGNVAPEATADFGKRLVALAAAHDVLLRQNWSAASLRDVAAGVLVTFDAGPRLRLEGPELAIGPRATLALSLLLHELATNATKYGSLSVPDGVVTLTWSQSGDGPDDIVSMRWAERGGPPAREPTRKGFGSRIIRMGLSGSGGTKLCYAEEGLTVDVTATFRQLQQA